MKKPSLSVLAFLGWEMYFNGKTREELDGMTDFQSILEADDFERFLQECADDNDDETEGK